MMEIWTIVFIACYSALLLLLGSKLGYFAGYLAGFAKGQDVANQEWKALVDDLKTIKGGKD